MSTSRIASQLRTALPSHFGKATLIGTLLAAPGIASIVIAETTAPPHVVINEVVASNATGLADQDGDHPDWIELYNADEEPVSLEGWTISDDEGRPDRWEFEQGTLEPGEHYLLFASGKDLPHAEPPHTNFRIASEGEPLLLSDEEGNTVDALPPTEIPTDVSWGRQPDGADNFYYFAEPTPGEANTTEPFAEVLPPPLFSHPGGFYTEGFELTITPGEGSPEGITILYTLDGSIPDPENIGGTTYQYKTVYPERPGDPFGDFHDALVETMEYNGEAILIEDRSHQADQLSKINTTFRADMNGFAPTAPAFKGTPVRARAFAPGSLPSSTTTSTYFVTEQGADLYSLPVISLTTGPDRLFGYEEGIYVPGKRFDDWRANFPNSSPNHLSPANYRSRGIDWERTAHFEFFDGTAHPVLSQQLGLRIHGNSSRTLPLKSMRLYPRNKYDEENRLNYPFFPGLVNRVDGQPIDDFNRLLLRNSGRDYHHTTFRDAFVHLLLRPLDLDYQAYRPAVHFINGEFWGIINMRERVDANYIAAQYLIDRDDVALLDVNAAITDGPVDMRLQYLQLRQFIDDNDMSQPENLAYVEEQMDIENFIRYLAAQIYINNRDWPGNNIRYWRKIEPDLSSDAHPRHDGRWRWILNDFDDAFGDHPGPDISRNALEVATAPNGPSWPNPPWSTIIQRNLLENEAVATMFINEVADQMNSVFRPAHFEPLLAQLDAAIAPHREEHLARWADTMRRDVTLMNRFGHERPAHMRQHMLDYFGLDGTFDVTLRNETPLFGSVRINSLVIDSTTPGIENPAAPYPWEGMYYQDVPIEIEAIANPHFRFVGWTGDLEGSPQSTVVTSKVDFDATAHFVFDPDPSDPMVPLPHALRIAPYHFDAWSPDAEPGTYPTAMVFRQTPVQDPTLDIEMEEPWTMPYNLESRSRVVGLDAGGFAFINTSNPQEDGGGYLGEVVLALDTRGIDAATVGFTAGTVLPNERTYAWRLQYRIGPHGEAIPFLDEEGFPIEYVRNEQAGHSETFSDLALPAGLLGQPYVELIWRYYYIDTGTSGPRAMLRLSDIEVTAQPAAADVWMLR